MNIYVGITIVFILILIAALVYVARITFRGNFIAKNGEITTGKIQTVDVKKDNLFIQVVFYDGIEKIIATSKVKNNKDDQEKFQVGNIINLKFDKMHPQTIEIIDS